MIYTQTCSPAKAEEEEGFSPALRALWRRIPNKGFFFLLLAAWLALFQFFGNATLGYIPSHSLYWWMFSVYNQKPTVGEDQNWTWADDSVGNIIPFLVLGLLWWKRQELRGLSLKNWWPGLLLVATALFLHLIGYALQQPRVSIVGLFFGIFGLAGLAWGGQWLRTTFFPFFLFAFMVPLSTILAPITFRLQMLVTKIVVFLCHDILGFSVVREGTQLVNGISNYHYEVSAACGGIRSLVIIGLIGVVYAFMVFPAMWQRLLLIACAIPFAVMGNTLRLFAIVATAEAQGQAAGMSVHDSPIWSILPYLPAIIGFRLLGLWMEDHMISRRDKKDDFCRQPAAS